MIITVKAARVNAGMSQQEVANALKMSVNTYAKKENGTTKFYVDEIAKISKLFNISIENFFESSVS
ncbi:MAG: XRE family transcriptional regulator [Bacteroidia bacterium]|nr:XRE family transcriptional regulator [Bacteroidia bacterium]